MAGTLLPLDGYEILESTKWDQPPFPFLVEPTKIVYIGIYYSDIYAFVVSLVNGEWEVGERVKVFDNTNILAGYSFCYDSDNNKVIVFVSYYNGSSFHETKLIVVNIDGLICSVGTSIYLETEGTPGVLSCAYDKKAKAIITVRSVQSGTSYRLYTQAFDYNTETESFSAGVSFSLESNTGSNGRRIVIEYDEANECCIATYTIPDTGVSSNGFKTIFQVFTTVNKTISYGTQYVVSDSLVKVDGSSKLTVVDLLYDSKSRSWIVISGLYDYTTSQTTNGLCTILKLDGEVISFGNTTQIFPGSGTMYESYIYLTYVSCIRRIQIWWSHTNAASRFQVNGLVENMELVIDYTSLIETVDDIWPVGGINLSSLDMVLIHYKDYFTRWYPFTKLAVPFWTHFNGQNETVE